MRPFALTVLLLACGGQDSGKGGGDTSPKAGAESGEPSEGGSSDGADGGQEGGSDGADGDSSSGDGADGSADSGGDGASDSGRDSDEPPPPPPPTIVRFLVLGDGGEGNKAQYAVADAMLNICTAKADDEPGCDFVLYLGDNFYDDGVSSADDEQFQTKFELPYAELLLPFYVVLGNHDYGSLSLLEYKAEYEVEYTLESDKWYLPDRYYSVDVDHLRLFGLDTNRIMLEVLWGDGGQPDWFDSTLASSTASWNIAFGHHPYISNGQHGNAGEYEGYEWLPIANGETVKEFVEERICGDIDVYFAGHDHNRQWLEPTCGTEFIVSGAAAKTTDLEGRGTPTLFEDDSDEGFMWVELRDDHFTGEFYNSSGTLEYSREFDRTP